MEMRYVIEADNLYKKLGSFELDIPRLRIPEGFATALIGENGAGKTTLINILAGLRLDAKGDIRWFGNVKDIDTGMTRERIGYTGPGNYYLPSWTVKQVRQISELLFPSFHTDRFTEWCARLAIDVDAMTKEGKKISKLSDGNRMKLMLAGVLARDTNLLLLDEPASPLDPLMRDGLNNILRDYLAAGDDSAASAQTDEAAPAAGGRTVFFSTHNIADMESVTDYAIIMTHGKIAEEGFVEDLKEKYIMVKGDADTAGAAKEILYSFSGTGSYGYEGLCLAADADKLSGLSVSLETPTLTQISVAVMKQGSHLAGVRAV